MPHDTKSLCSVARIVIWLRDYRSKFPCQQIN